MRNHTRQPAICPRTPNPPRTSAFCASPPPMTPFARAGYNREHCTEHVTPLEFDPATNGDCATEIPTTTPVTSVQNISQKRVLTEHKIFIPLSWSRPRGDSFRAFCP